MQRIGKQREIRNDREPGEVRVEFSGTNMTPFGGFGLVRKFIYVTLKLSQNYPWQREYRQEEARLAALNFISA